MAYKKPVPLTGPASSTDNAIVRWNGTDGTAIQNTSQVTINDSGSLTASVNTAAALFNNLTNTTGDCKWELVSASDSWAVMVPQGVAANSWYFGLDNSDDDAFIFGSGNSFAAASSTYYRVDNAGIFAFKKGMAVNFTTKAVSYNVLATDYIVAVTDNTVARTISLPQASDGIVAGQIFIVKDEAGTAASANNITIDTQGTETIDGAASVTISTNYGSRTIYYNGTNFFNI